MFTFTPHFILKCIVIQIKAPLFWYDENNYFDNENHLFLGEYIAAICGAFYQHPHWVSTQMHLTVERLCKLGEIHTWKVLSKFTGLVFSLKITW